MTTAVNTSPDRFGDVAVRRSGERGHVQIGWLDSRHTFSFGSYYDPAHVNFGNLRVINEDVVQPSTGFGEHPHENMEIISYVVDGVLAHRDNTGGGGEIRPGEVQVMTAGRGIRHSEMNPSAEGPVHLLQIWITPRAQGTEPGYDQRDFGREPGVKLLVSGDPNDDALTIGQDAKLYRVLAGAGEAHGFTFDGTRAWVQVVRGDVTVGDVSLSAGDAGAFSAAEALTVRTASDAEVLVFDLP